MNMPGFAAEASLYKARTQYSMNNTEPFGAEAEILPQLIKGTGKRPGNRALDRICGQIADLINGVLAEGYRYEMQGNFEEGNAYHNLAIELIGRAESAGHCSVSQV